MQPPKNMSWCLVRAPGKHEQDSRQATAILSFRPVCALERRRASAAKSASAFFPGPLLLSLFLAAKPHPSASKPFLTGQGNRPWKQSSWNLSSAPSRLGGQGPGPSPLWAPISSSGKRKELDRRVPKEPSSPVLLDLNVYIRRVKCLPEHSS